MASNQLDAENSQIKPSETSQIVYSDYGYIIVDQTEYKNNQLVRFRNLGNNFNGTINKGNIRSSLTIKLKTLYGTHKLYSFDVLPTDQIKDLIKKLQDEEEKDTSDKVVKYNNGMTYRFISTKGSITQIDITKKFYEHKLTHNQILILAPNLPVYFNEKNHGCGIAIENKSTVHKVEGDEFEMALVDKGCSFGCLFTEFILQTEPDEKTIIIGVSLPQNNYMLTDHKSFWGYVLSE